DYTPETFYQDLAKLIAVNHLPYSIADSLQFRLFVRMLCPGTLPFSSKGVKAVIEKEFSVEQQKVISDLK
ncbi:hypothetical protein HDU93_001988, partial [Gonapodya sp. JEL0774]